MPHTPWKDNDCMVRNEEFQTPVVIVPTTEEVCCPYCGRLFFKGALGRTTAIEIKCTRRGCAKIVTISKP